MTRTLPLAIFLILVLLLWRGLSLDPHKIPSQFINQPAPELGLPQLSQPNQLLQTTQLKGNFYLLHVWATWCATCREEQPLLMDLAQQGIPIYGVDYKDDPADASQWLKLYGNPYQKIGVDKTGKAAINWGVYGTPETFLVDKRGIIRYKQIGMLTHEIWQTKFLPIIRGG